MLLGVFLKQGSKAFTLRAGFSTTAMQSREKKSDEKPKVSAELHRLLDLFQEKKEAEAELESLRIQLLNLKVRENDMKFRQTMLANALIHNKAEQDGCEMSIETRQRRLDRIDMEIDKSTKHVPELK